MTTAAPTPAAPDALRAPHILVIEDNFDILANLHAFLEPLGYVIDSARTGPAGLAQASSRNHDVIVLDLMLPGMDGIDVCRRLRHVLRQATPVLMLTARDALQEKVAGFTAGADDYLVKPFSLVELDVRLKALHRRASGQQVATVLVLADLQLDLRTLVATRAGRRLRLTPSGVKLLSALMRSMPQVLTRAELERELWGDSPPASDALRVHMHALRQEIDRDAGTPLLRTVPGMGYSLDGDAA
jgi:DNA-binding response OmpR family regulator